MCVYIYMSINPVDAGLYGLFILIHCIVAPGLCSLTITSIVREQGHVGLIQKLSWLSPEP